MKRTRMSTYRFGDAADDSEDDGLYDGVSDPAMAAQLSDDIAWYNATPYAELTVIIHLGPRALSGWAAWEDVVTTLRQRKDPQKADPLFRFFVDPGADPEVFGRLEHLDVRLPRLTVCPIVPLASAADAIAHVKRLAGALSPRLLDLRLAFLPAELDELARVSEVLPQLCETPQLGDGSVVELGYAATGDGAGIEAAVAKLFASFPLGVETIAMSPGGYVRRFHQLKEDWYLSHITAREVRAVSDNLPEAVDVRLRVKDFDMAFYAEHASAEWYVATRSRKPSSILRFDLDSIADTYECQSPVFVDGKWILDRGRLAAQLDPVPNVILHRDPAPAGSTPVAEPHKLAATTDWAANGPETTGPAASTPLFAAGSAVSLVWERAGRQPAEKADVVLLKMPNHNMDYPHLAIPTLTAALRAKDYAVVQQDVNVQLRDALLTTAGLQELVETLLPDLACAFADSPVELERISNAIAYLRYVDANIGFATIEQTKRRMQARDYDALLTDPGSASTVTLIFVLTGMLHIVIDLCLTADEAGIGADNLVIRFLDEKVREVARLEPRVVGFSVIQIQRKATFWFARRLREVWHGTIAIGGPDPSTFVQEYLSGHPYIDLCFLKEAEQSLVAFLEGVPLADISGVVYRDADGVVRTNRANFDQAASEFRPDFDGFDLDTFLLPTLPLSTSRGCHFAKCTFCNHYKTYSGYYNNDAIRTVDAIEELSRRHNTRFFHFVDDMLEVESGTAIADEIIRRGLNVNIITYARFENAFQRDSSILERWYRAGIRVIEWGLESASQRVLKLMIKGISMGRVKTILDISSGQGIVNKLMLFHNYPGESVEDLKVTIDFLRTTVLARKVRPFFTVRGRYELRLFTPLELQSRTAKNSPFRKRYERSSSFDSLLGYADDDYYPEKVSAIDSFIDEMSGHVRERRVFSTNDENMSMDLIIQDMEQRGLEPALRTQ